MNKAELIGEALEVADLIEGWLNSLPAYERNSGDRYFDRRTMTALRATTDALEAAERELEVTQAVIAAAWEVGARHGAGKCLFASDGDFCPYNPYRKDSTNE